MAAGTVSNKTSNLRLEMRERMLADEERSEQAFEELSFRIALEAHEDRLKLWEDVERLETVITEAYIELVNLATNKEAFASWILNGLKFDAMRSIAVTRVTDETSHAPRWTEDYTVACKCGWQGQASTVFCRGMTCPECSAGFVPVPSSSFDYNAIPVKDSK